MSDPIQRLPALSVFFPAKDEAENVEAVVRDALRILPDITDRFEVTVIDDGSADDTGAIADRLAREDPRVRVVHHPTSRGYGGAVRSGLLAATEPYVFYTDGDQQFDLADLPRLVARIGDADVVVGYRLKRMDPRRRLVVAWVYNRIIRSLFGVGVRDVDCAYKLFRREVFTQVPLARVHSDGAFFSPELLITLRAAGVRIVEVDVPHYPRTKGEPKGAPPKVILRAIRDLLLLRLSLWLRPGG
ncbi:MAG TPA: glycosyltransferase family 2 protein [Candidatus Limnocylindria bacterium]